MKFQIRIGVSSDLAGVSLLREYQRLGFNENSRSNTFGTYYHTFEISEEMALKYPHFFEDSCCFECLIRSTDTLPSNWEDWGSAGMVLANVDMLVDYEVLFIESEKTKEHTSLGIPILRIPGQTDSRMLET